MIYLMNALAALILGPFVYPAAIASGEEARLCAALEGKYDPTAADHCKGGQWAKLVPLITETLPAPLPAK